MSEVAASHKCMILSRISLSIFYAREEIDRLVSAQKSNIERPEIMAELADWLISGSANFELSSPVPCFHRFDGDVSDAPCVDDTPLTVWERGTDLHEYGESLRRLSMNEIPSEVELVQLESKLGEISPVVEARAKHLALELADAAI